MAFLFQSYVASTALAAPAFTNGGQSTEVCPLSDASITCRVIDASIISQMNSMDDENKRLKKMFAELSMQNDLLEEALGKQR
tara:strand:+ start:5043 stop:5288 length:246 start_codon:yes stop_codon:yes gene_type:complete